MENRAWTRTRILAAAALFVLTISLFVVTQGAIFLYRVPQPRGEVRIQKVLVISEGETLRDTARRLYQQGLITRTEPFILAGKILAIEHRVIPGEYEIHNQMSPLDILRLLKDGLVIQYQVTIPEGFSLVQIALLLEEKGLVQADAFIQRAQDPKFIRSLGYEEDSLEGYLFPESYYFPKRIKIDEILRGLLREFEKTYTPDMAARAEVLGMTRHEVVTLAAMIEKESSVDSERPLVSAVFHNRIRKGIRLQSDPTVIYAIPNFDGNLTRRHLRTPSPYNTYTVKGLPLGPIANPGKASLLAALYPASVKYLYFVSKNDGTHYFSLTLREHNRAVRRYQQKRS